MASVRERHRKDGTRYWSVLYNLNGKQTSTSLSVKADADQLCELINRVGAARALQIHGIERVDRSLTVAGWVKYHIDHLPGVEKRSVDDYRGILRNDISPHLGAIPLAHLSRDDIVGWLEHMRESGSSGKTISNKHRLLSGALKTALRAGHIPTNPAAGIRMPRTRRKGQRHLTPAEFNAILTEIPEYWKPFVRFLVASGCRLNEATALRPYDVDRLNHTVRITQARKRQKGGYVLGTTKTAAGERTADVPADVLDTLTYTNDFLFVGRTGKPVNAESFRSNVWWPAVARAKIAAPRPRIHDLRHTCASWMIQNGIALPVIQQQLGHESIEVTVGTYGHLDRTTKKAGAAAIAKMMASSQLPQSDSDS